MDFEFATAGRIIFGAGSFQRLPGLAAKLGRKAFIVTGSSGRHTGQICRKLGADGLQTAVFNTSGEPTTDTARKAVSSAREAAAEVVIAVGGGSVIDTGKAVAALLTNRGDLFDYLEVIGKGEKIENPSAPFIAVPTTAGTGAEVTRNAVLLSPEDRVKVSMRSPLMLPRIALVDPDLTRSMPPAVTAASGLDAFTQLLEAFVTPRANPLTDGICREGLSRAARSLLRAYQNGDDRRAREDMSLASLFGGLALANAKLGAVHGFAGPLGGMFGAPHGTVCARLLPLVMEVNVTALRDRDPDSPALPRYRELARIVTGKSKADAEEGVARVRELCRELAVPPLSKFNLRESDFPDVIEKARGSSSMKGNPIELETGEMESILREAL